MNKSLEKYNQFLNFVSFKHNLNFDEIMIDFEEFVKSEKESLVETTIEDDYATFLDKKEEEMQNEFNLQNNFQTNVRGLKVRGVYPSQEEAELRCKMLREIDPHHNVYVGPVGMWMPWEPDAYKTGRVEYLEEQLNQLMKEKNNNDGYAKDQFDKRVRDAKKNAVEENIKMARKTGNKLTQNIDKEGELVGNETNTIERSLGSNENLSSADIRKELFEGENVRTKESDSPKTARRKMIEKYSNKEESIDDVEESIDDIKSE